MKLGAVTAMVGIGWLVASVPLSMAILFLMFDGGATANIVATVLRLLLLVWLIASLVLVVKLIWKSVSLRTPQQVSTVAAIRPAGWYPDPYGTGRLRWWDGTVWRDQFADPPVSPA